MRISSLLIGVMSSVADVLAPDACHLCGRVFDPARVVESCHPDAFAEAVASPVRVGRGVLSIESHPICRGCAGGLVPTDGPSQVRSGDLSMSVVTPFFSNARLLEVIHLVKFRRYRHAVRGLARAVAHAIPAEKRRVDALVPVPMDPRSRRRRGFNQADLLAGELASVLGVPRRPSWLTKRRRTRAQSLLALEERSRNVSGAFKAGSAVVAGASVGIVDDLVTSGATALACARVLRAAGAHPTVVLAVGRTGTGGKGRSALAHNGQS